MTSLSSMSKISSYPGLDWDRTVELAAGSEEFAVEMLTLFINTLPEENSVLQQAYQSKDYTALRAQAHRIHGTLCYCVFPQLKYEVLNLEKVCAEEDVTQIESRYSAIQTQVAHLLEFVA